MLDDHGEKELPGRTAIVIIVGLSLETFEEEEKDDKMGISLFH